MAGVPRVYFDAPALAAAAAAGEGPLAAVLALAESGRVELHASASALAGVDGEVSACRRLCRPVGHPPEHLIQEALEVTVNPEGARDLAGAASCGADFLVLVDRYRYADFRKLRRHPPCPLGTPEDFLGWMRARVRT